MFTGYQGWIDGIRDWLDVDDYTDAQIASFLSLAQVRMNTDLMSSRMEKNTTLTIDGVDIIPGEPVDLDTAIPDFSKIRLVIPSWAKKASDVAAINELLSYIASDAYYDDELTYYAIDSMQLHMYPPTLQSLKNWTRIFSLNITQTCYCMLAGLKQPRIWLKMSEPLCGLKCMVCLLKTPILS